jgi:hypothetical protein
MADLTYGPKVYRKRGGNQIVVADGGNILVESGGTVTVESGGVMHIAAVGGLKIGEDNVGVATIADVTATAAELNQYSLTLDIADLSAEATYYIVAPHAGDIAKIFSVIDGAVSTADVTITASIAGTPVTNGVVTIAYSGSGAGDVDVASPSAANTVTAGQAIGLTVTGGGDGGGPKGHVTIVITR